MFDLTGNSAIDVAIGLSFIYFVASLVCSAVNEMIASVFRLRGAELERGIRSLLVDQAKADAFYANARIASLHQPIRIWTLPDRRPSYIPARTFALALIDTLVPPAAGETTAANGVRGAHTDANVLAKVNAVAGGLPANSALRTMLEDAVAESRGRLDAFRTSIEKSFDGVMDRVSGWYKRRVQIFLLVIALLIVAVANLDSFAIGQTLYRDEAVRTAVVARASAQTSGTDCDQNAKTTGLQDTATCIDQISDLNLPAGWSDATAPNDATGWLFKAFGLIVTAFALSLGAPFWFDTLGKLARLRGTGNREGTEKADGRAPSDRDERRVR